MGDDINARLAAANPTELLSPRELVEQIRNLTAQLAARDAEVAALRAMVGTFATVLEDDMGVDCDDVPYCAPRQKMLVAARALLAAAPRNEPEKSR
jgi:hypothetical protein